MRLLSPYFVAAFRGRILNIHPSLLPAFPGLEAQRQALEYGVKFSGCTVHFVDENLDAGPIVAQAIVPVEPGDTDETLAARILREEHRIYTEAVRLVLSGKFRIEGRRVLPIAEQSQEERWPRALSEARRRSRTDPHDHFHDRAANISLRRRTARRSAQRRPPKSFAKKSCAPSSSARAPRASRCASSSASIPPRPTCISATPSCCASSSIFRTRATPRFS